MTPAQHVRLVLAAARDRDPDRTGFMTAWRRALATLPRPRDLPDDARRELETWQDTLRWARPFYQAAYEAAGHPSAPPDAPVNDDGRPEAAVEAQGQVPVAA